MRILVYEDNLLWSSRFLKTLRALGHDPEVRTKPDPAGAPVAIVNLGSPGMNAEALVPALITLGVHVIGHAGHKEKEILELGRAAGCQTVATNSEITYKIEDLLKKAAPMNE